MMRETYLGRKCKWQLPRDTGNLSLSKMSLTMLSLWIYAP